MDFFGSEQWKSIQQVDPHLVPKNTKGAGAGAVTFERSMLKRVFQQIQIAVHAAKVAHFFNQNTLSAYTQRKIWSAEQKSVEKVERLLFTGIHSCFSASDIRYLINTGFDYMQMFACYAQASDSAIQLSFCFLRFVNMKKNYNFADRNKFISQ